MTTHPFISQKAVLPLAIAAFLMPVLLIEYPILQFTHGVFAYPIDDTCIHLTIARNLAYHQVWGTYSGEFASAASSILYPLLLAVLVKIFGSHLILPFLANVGAALVLLLVLQRWLVRQGLGPIAQLLVLCGVIFLTPLAPLVISGMEHVLQFLFTFLFISRLAENLERYHLADEKKRRLPSAIYIYGALMVSTRYEGMVILGLGSLLLLRQKRIWQAGLLFICGMLPITLFGIYAVRHGNFFFPNSVLLKSGAPELTLDGLYNFFTNDLFYKLFYSVVGYNTIATQRALIILLLSFLVFRKGLQEKSAYKYLLLLLTAAVFIHMSLTGYARFPRYEAYLIGCVVTVVGLLAAKYGPVLYDLRKMAAVITVIFLAFPLLLRSIDAYDQVEEGSYATYKVLYTAGTFLHKYYNQDAVALECLGVMSYFSEGKKMDVVGLGDIAVAKRMRAHRYSVGFLDSLSKKENVQIAAGTPISTPPDLLKRWTIVGSWYLPTSEGGSYISFYAVNPSKTQDLKLNLIAFEKYLPEGEKAVYY
jgi:hypothetical protein